MKVYQLSPEFFGQLRRRLLLILVPLFVVIIGIASWQGARKDLSKLPIYLLVGLAVMGIATPMALRQQNQSWASYRLMLKPDSVAREQIGMPMLEINKGEIARILERQGTGLVVEATDKKRQLAIPETLEGYAEVRAQFETWHTIESVTSGKAALNVGILVLAALLPLLGIIIIGTSTNSFVVIAVGVLLVATFLWGLVTVQRSVNMDKRTKWGVWFILLPTLGIAWRVIDEVSRVLSTR